MEGDKARVACFCVWGASLAVVEVCLAMAGAKELPVTEQRCRLAMQEGGRDVLPPDTAQDRARGCDNRNSRVNWVNSHREGLAGCRIVDMWQGDCWCAVLVLGEEGLLYMAIELVLSRQQGLFSAASRSRMSDALFHPRFFAIWSAGGELHLDSM